MTDDNQFIVDNFALVASFHIGDTVTVVLRDGRRFDVTGLAPAEAITLLTREGVTAADIKNTIHRIGRR